jgi:hypothetical protein
MNKRTVLKALDEIPEPYRSQAIHYIRTLRATPDYIDMETTDSVRSILTKGFDWHSSSEGYNYWRKFVNTLS